MGMVNGIGEPSSLAAFLRKLLKTQVKARPGRWSTLTESRTAVSATGRAGNLTEEREKHRRGSVLKSVTESGFSEDILPEPLPTTQPLINP
jgi:hypothetical protein